MSSQFEGYKVLLTGAGGGIGAEIARALAARGAILAISGRNVDALAALASELGDSPRRAQIIRTDLSSADEAAALPGKAADAIGGLDCVINCAGIAFQRSVADTDAALWDLIMAVNARAPFLICREATPFLKKSERPRVINISSVVGSKGYELQAAYAASKHALEGFTKVYAREVHDSGIGVHLVAPGGVDTKMVSEMRPDIDGSQLIPPADVAEAVVFLLGERGNGFVDRIDIRRFGKRPWG